MSSALKKLEVREEATTDAAAIDALITAAFLDAPHTSHTEQHIVKALRAADKLAISLVAEMNGVIVGHLAVSPVTISDGTPNWFGLGPISVAPEHQRRGIGSSLMREALDRLRRHHAAGCVLLGNPEYYQRFGFKAEAGLVLPDVPSQYFQALSFGPSLPRGTVAYHAAFDAS